MSSFCFLRRKPTSAAKNRIGRKTNSRPVFGVVLMVRFDSVGFGGFGEGVEVVFKTICGLIFGVGVESVDSFGNSDGVAVGLTTAEGATLSSPAVIFSLN